MDVDTLRLHHVTVDIDTNVDINIDIEIHVYMDVDSSQKVYRLSLYKLKKKLVRCSFLLIPYVNFIKCIILTYCDFIISKISYPENFNLFLCRGLHLARKISGIRG